MKKISIFLLLLVVLTQSFGAYADDSYPAGGLQLLNTFDDGVQDGAFEIGKALKLEYDKEKYTTELVTGFEGITVNNSATENTEYNYATEGPNATLIIEYDIKFDDLVSSGSSMDMCIGTSDTNQGTAATTLKFSGADKDITCINKPGGTYRSAKAVIGELEDGRWYHIRNVIPVTNSAGGFAPKHTVYINGVECFPSASFSSTNYYKFPRINKLYTIKYESASKSGTTYYIDNFMAYKTNVNTTTAPEDFGKYLTAVRDAECLMKQAVVGTEVGQYDPEVYAQTERVMNEAKAAYADADKTVASLDVYIERLTETLKDFVPIKEAVTVGAPTVKYTFMGTEMPVINFADAAVITIPVETSKYAAADGETVSAIVLLKGADDADGDESVLDLFTSGNVRFLPSETRNVVVNIDLSQYAGNLDVLKTLSFKVMVWNGYGTEKPHLIPAVEL